jgi:hypothetical protein
MDCFLDDATRAVRPTAENQYLLCDHAVVNENGTRMCPLFDQGPTIAVY